MFDEPLGALDAFTRMAMQDEILRIRHENIMTMVMVTHDVDEAVYSQPKLKSIDEATEYNLYYELDGGVNADSNKDKYAENSTVNLASPTKRGFDFKGWYWDKDFNSIIENSTFSGKAQDLKVYAKWDMSSDFVNTYSSNMVTIIPKGYKIEIEDFAGTKETQVIYAYNISKYEITQGLYKAVMGENPSKFEGSENPVERVSCYYILDYITSLVLKKVIIKK